MTPPKPPPTARIRCVATKAALIEALVEMGNSPDFRHTAWSIMDAEELERVARRIRDDYAEAAKRRAER